MELPRASLPQAEQGRLDQWPHWPFCSKRCRLIDLGRWLGGDYRIASPLDDEIDDSDTPKPAVPSADSHSEAP